MFQLIIVDDEVREVKGIKSTVNFEKLGFTNIFEAYNMAQAKEVFNNQSIDVLLCDIEMPMGSGLELLAWVREHHPKTECIFLTCHAAFNYARQAVQLGSLDYLLKPIEADELEKVLSKAIDKVSNQNELNKQMQFSKLWLKHQPLLIERFWMDILTQKIPSSPSAIKKAAGDINYPGMEKMAVLPVLIKEQRWQEKMSVRDGRLMEFALKNIAEELILKSSDNGMVLEMGEGVLLSLIYIENDSNQDISQLKVDCEKYIEACNQYLSCDLSCYIGYAADIHDLVDQVGQLHLMDKDNDAYTNRVFLIQDQIRCSPVIEKAMDFIKQNISAELTREDIANYVFLTPEYLSRIFKKETGMNIPEYIVKERLKIAKELLEKSELPITIVALQAGYTNFPYFSTIFKKQTGMNPNDFRKRNSQKYTREEIG